MAVEVPAFGAFPQASRERDSEEKEKKLHSDSIQFLTEYSVVTPGPYPPLNKVLLLCLCVMGEG